MPSSAAPVQRSARDYIGRCYYYYLQSVHNFAIIQPSPLAPSLHHVVVVFFGGFGSTSSFSLMMLHFGRMAFSSSKHILSM